MKTNITIKMSVLAAFFALFTAPAYCQSSFHEYPNNVYEDTANIAPQAMTFDNSGNTFYASAAHYLFDNGVITQDRGIRIWKRETGGAYVGNNYYKYYMNGANDYAVKMIYLNSALYVLVQGTKDIFPYDQDVILLKYNSSMVFQWSRLFNSSGNNDLAIDLAAGASSSILFLAKSQGNMHILRYNSAGTLLNSGSYDSGAGDDAPARLRYANNATYVAGTRPAASGRQTVLVKYNNTLVQQWALLTKLSNAAGSDLISDMVLDSSGNIYVAGSHNYSGNIRGYIYKALSTGPRAWIRRLTYNSSNAFRIFTDNNAQPFMYVNATPDRYMRFDKGTGVISFNNPVFNHVNTTFLVRSVEKGSDNNIYIGGDYDSLNAFGYLISKMNTSASRTWNYINISFEASFTKNVYQIAVRGNSKVYYYFAESWVGWAGSGQSEDYVRIGAINASNGMREGDLEAVVEQKMEIYPNPADNWLHIDYVSTSDEERTVDIYSMNGQLMKSFTNVLSEGRNTIEIDVSDLESGIYILRMNDEEMQKVVISR